MYKLAGFLPFRPELDRDEARSYWRDVHGPLVAQIPGLVRMVQNDYLGPLPGASPADGGLTFDGYVAHWYPDRDALLGAMRSPEWQRVMEDGARIIDVEAAVMGPVDERVIEDGAAGPFKTIGIAHFPEGADKRAASRYWTDVHGPLTLKAGGFVRYVQNHAIPDPDWNLALDGFAEHWYADEASYEHAVASAGWQKLVEDGPNFLDTERFSGAIVNERVWENEPAGAR